MFNKITAVYKDGAFHLTETESIHLRNGTKVRLTIEVDSLSPNVGTLELAAQVFAGLTGDEVDMVERIAIDRTSF